MSVLTCTRTGCFNVMCDIYVHSIGYICNECAREFIQKYSHKSYESDYEIKKELHGFMQDQKHTERFPTTDLQEWINQFRT